jgi:hypothetical protein
MVSMWMPHGTLAEYVSQRESVLSLPLPSRIQLVSTRDSGTVMQLYDDVTDKGTAAGLEYRMFQNLVSRALI